MWFQSQKQIVLALKKSPKDWKYVLQIKSYYEVDTQNGQEPIAFASSLPSYHRLLK